MQNRVKRGSTIALLDFRTKKCCEREMQVDPVVSAQEGGGNDSGQSLERCCELSLSSIYDCASGSGATLQTTSIPLSSEDSPPQSILFLPRMCYLLCLA